MKELDEIIEVLVVENCAINMQELDEIIELFEADIPANPESPKSKRLSGQLEDDLVRYFKRLGDLVSAEDLSAVWLAGNADDLLDNNITVLRAYILAKIKNHLVNIFIQADLEVINWGITKAGFPILYEGPPIEQAIKWAEKHGAELVTKMDEETKRRLAKVIADAIENKRGISGLASDIRLALKKEFAEMSIYRSKLIANTETARALRAAGRERMSAMGVTGKRWVLGSGGEEGNCADCVANAAVGDIPVDQEFPNPEESIHPNCTCAVAPVMLK